MLSKMRNEFKRYQWTLWLVIIAFAGGFILTDLFSTGSIGKSDVVIINDNKIKAVDFQKELLRSLESFERRLKQKNMKLSKQMIQQFNLPLQALQQLIQSTIIKIEAGKYDIKVSEEEIQNQVRKIFSDKNGFVGLERYKNFIRSTYRMTSAEYESQLAESLRLEKLKALITSGMVIKKEELFKLYRDEKDKVTVEYIMFGQDDVKDKIVIKDAELGNYYQKNKNSFKSREKRKGTLLLLDNETYKNKIKITDIEIYEHYKKNKEQFKEPGKTKVLRIFLKYNKDNRSAVLKKAEALQKTLTAKNFSQQAKEISEDDKAKNGGDYGYLNWKSLSSQENDTIERLNHNDISIPVDTTTGFAIFYIAEKVHTRQKVLNDVKKTITDTILANKLKLRVKEEADRIYNQIKDGKNLKTSAEKTGIKTRETDLLEAGEIIKDIDLTGTLSRALFNLEKDQISKPVNYFKGAAIIQLTDIQPPRVQPLSAVKQRVIEQIQNEKKVILLKKKSKDLADKVSLIKDNKKLKEFCTKKKLNLQTTTYTRGNKFLTYNYHNLDKIIFSMQENIFSNPLKMDNNYAIIRVTEKKLSLKSDFETAQSEYYKTKITELKNDYFAAYISEKRKKYEIRFNEDLYKQILERELGRFKN